MWHPQISIKDHQEHIVCMGLFRFRIIVESKNIQGRPELAVAALNLIDLAGSESADVHGPMASSARSKEMKYINKVSF